MTSSLLKPGTLVVQYNVHLEALTMMLKKDNEEKRSADDNVIIHTCIE